MCETARASQASHPCPTHGAAAAKIVAMAPAQPPLWWLWGVCVCAQLWGVCVCARARVLGGGAEHRHGAWMWGDTWYTRRGHPPPKVLQLQLKSRVSSEWGQQFGWGQQSEQLHSGVRSEWGPSGGQWQGGVRGCWDRVARRWGRA